MFGTGTDAPKLQKFGPGIFEMSALVRRDWLIREKAHGVCRDGGVGRTHPATSDTHQVTQANLHCVVSGARFAGGVGGGLRPSLCELSACSLSECNLRTTSALLVTHLTLYLRLDYRVGSVMVQWIIAGISPNFRENGCCPHIIETHE